MVNTDFRNKRVYTKPLFWHVRKKGECTQIEGLVKALIWQRGGIKVAYVCMSRAERVQACLSWLDIRQLSPGICRAEVLEQHDVYLSLGGIYHCGHSTRSECFCSSQAELCDLPSQTANSEQISLCQSMKTYSQCLSENQTAGLWQARHRALASSSYIYCFVWHWASFSADVMILM